MKVTSLKGRLTCSTVPSSSFTAQLLFVRLAMFPFKDKFFQHAYFLNFYDQNCNSIIIIVTIILSSFYFQSSKPVIFLRMEKLHNSSKS